MYCTVYTDTVYSIVYKHRVIGDRIEKYDAYVFVFSK